MHVSSWRSDGSIIRKTNGTSNGIIPFLRILNNVARAFNQGGNKRKGSIAVYLETHHADIRQFLQLTLPSGDENLRCRDLFPALWVSDLFMERVQKDEMWSLFSPDDTPDLNKTFGEDYRRLYQYYEDMGFAKSKVKARELWLDIFISQKESGLPYILYKDTCNQYSNQRNVGTIQSSNLCAEIVLYSDSRETSVCNLASICLPSFITRDSEGKATSFQFQSLSKVAGELVENLNVVIDHNMYPTIESARSNIRHRPIGIGIQGLIDVFHEFKLDFESSTAVQFSKDIAEAIYYGALSSSTKQAKQTHEVIPSRILQQFPSLIHEPPLYPSKEYPGAYPSYQGSPMEKDHLFHWEQYGATVSSRFDWETLRSHIQKFGLRNSVCIAYMPTASTSQIMGYSSCFEPYVSNMFKRNTLAGEHIIINRFLIDEAIQHGVSLESLREHLIEHEGSVQSFSSLPENVRVRFKTAYEIKQKAIMDHAIARQPFIDQSQSMNLFVDDFTFEKMHSMQMYAWKNKLKTGVYYTRTLPGANAQKFILNSSKIQSGDAEIKGENDEEQEFCLLCSS